MLQYIEKLRKKPESTRRTAALLISVAVLVAIFIAWLTALPGKIANETEGGVSEQSSPSPFELVKNGASSVYRDFNDMVDNAENAWPF